MNQTERLYRIDQLLNERTVVPLQVFLTELEISHATFKRDLDYLRDRMNAPIEWDRDAGGYRFRSQGAGAKYELPGLWFNQSEIYALLTMRQLLASLGPGLLTAQVEPLLTRMRLLMGEENVSIKSFEQRVRILRLHARTCESEHFEPVATAVMQRRRLVFSHHNKFRNEVLRREVSPQRLTHYRENWYLDAWCHLRNELRSFGLSALREVTITEVKAQDVTESELRRTLDAGYGIFSGKQTQWAELVFTSERARWVAQETWHEQQVSWFDSDDSYHLRVPYSDPREISMDILRHVPHVRIVAPESLRSRVIGLLKAGLQQI